jgi:hypothetical protein
MLMWVGAPPSGLGHPLPEQSFPVFTQQTLVASTAIPAVPDGPETSVVSAPPPIGAFMTFPCPSASVQ